MTNEDKDMLTVREAADLLKVSIAAIHNAIQRGRIDAQKFGVQYAIPKESVLEYQKTRRPAPPRNK